jgi:esterase/lipase
MTHSDLHSHPNPAQSYAEAAERIQAWAAEAPADMLPAGRLLFMSHAQKVERAVVFVHGYTACPEQFRPLGQLFYERGYNVLIAPLPYHGLADRLTTVHAQLRASELAAYADRAVDIAQGLGNAVTVAGLSMGGVVTTWVGHYRRDVALAVPISPALGMYVIPALLTPLVAGVMGRVPNQFQWWDPVRQADDGFDYGYPQYATRALAEMVRLGLSVQRSAQTTPPAARALLAVTNANDRAVNNTVTRGLVQAWRRHNPAQVQTFEFEADLRLIHDLIDPNHRGQRVDVVYPKLLALVTEAPHA